MPITVKEIAWALNQADEDELRNVGTYLLKAVVTALEQKENWREKLQEVLGISEIDEDLAKLEGALEGFEVAKIEKTPAKKASKKKGKPESEIELPPS